MIEVSGQRIFFGDFHGQWNANEAELALLVAGWWRHGYDFTAFQTPNRFAALTQIMDALRIPMRIFPGREYMYEWGHLTTVGVEGEAPPIDDPDCDGVLAWFKQHSALVVLAHPYTFMIDRLESLLDRHLLDAVELVNGPLKSNRNERVILWYEEMTRRNKKPPIVSGLDIHIPTGSRRPSVLYTDAYPPAEDISLFGANRTGVVAATSDFENIKQAMAEGRTFIELSAQRRLVGPPALIATLIEGGYWDRVEEDLARRQGIEPQVEGRIIGGRANSFTFSSPVHTVRLDGTEINEGLDGPVPIPVPLPSSRNTQYVNIVSQSHDSFGVHALKVYHPLTVEMVSETAGGRHRTITTLVNASDAPLEDVTLSISCGEIQQAATLPSVAPYAAKCWEHDWSIPEPGRPTRFDIQADHRTFQKHVVKHQVFVECPYLETPDDPGAWEGVRPVRLSGHFPEQVDTDYTVAWNGDDDLSADVRMAWNREALYFRTATRDDVLVASKINLPMFGDCFQIGINPIATDAVGNQSLYDIMMTRGGSADGIEKAYMERSVNMALEYPLPKRFVLQGLYHGAVRDGVFEGLLTLPFHLMAPMQPVAGWRFGLYYVIFDNDGTGLKTALQWPLHAERHVGQAWYVPYGGAWASVELMPPPISKEHKNGYDAKRGDS